MLFDICLELEIPAEVIPMQLTPRMKLVLDQLVADWATLTPAAFAQRLEEFDGRKIKFIPLPMPAGYFGGRVVVVHDEDTTPDDLVFYNATLPLAHQEHVLIHELAHIALGHDTLHVTPEQAEQALQNPARAAEQWACISCRALNGVVPDSLLAQQDQEAEMLARLIFQRILAARQNELLKRSSSQSYLDDSLRRMGIA